MKNKIKAITLIFLETILLLVVFSSLPQEVLATVGNPAESMTNLTIANSYPEVYNITINDENPITLIPNQTTEVHCKAIIVDWNGDSDIYQANATLFDSSIPITNPDDGNDHYTNSSCQINTTFSYMGITDTSENALADCTFRVQYYANPGNWNCTVQANDTFSGIGTGTNQEQISNLLSIGLPDIIQYGTINATSVSQEQQVNISNFGNIKVNLTLEGYGYTPSDGNAMNCTLGSNKNISVDLEKYNLTAPNQGTINLTEFETNYTNLTDSPEIKQFNLTSRISEITDDTIKPTYWRIYVPKGVAGTCQGNIVFGATTASES